MLNANLMDIIDVSSLGLGRKPDMRTRISYDHISKLILHRHKDSRFFTIKFRK